MSDEEEPFIATVLFRAELSDLNVPHVDVELSLPQLWAVHRTFHCGGFEESRMLIAFASVLMGALVDANVTDTAKSFDEAWYSFGAVFDLPERQWKTETDLALSFCYYLLRQELINRTEAAELGRNIIEDHDRPVTAAEVEAFRKRVDRWGERHSLPRPGQPRRRTLAA
jgi:hypothetical protein